MSNTSELTDLINSSEEALHARDYERALELTLNALAIDELDDDANRYHLEALGGLGRRSEIVSHYQEYVRKLSEAPNNDDPDNGRPDFPIAA